MGMQRFMLSITEEMEKALEKERKKRMLETIPETARVLLGEYLAKVGTMALTPVIIGGFYFEIGEIEGIIRIAAFVTPHKPNLLSKPIPNETLRISRLKKLFSDLNELGDYKVETERVGMLLAQGTEVDVLAIRANISRKDKREITIKEVVDLIAKRLA